jgi:hypothetical protein
MKNMLYILTIALLVSCNSAHEKKDITNEIPAFAGIINPAIRQ